MSSDGETAASSERYKPIRVSGASAAPTLRTAARNVIVSPGNTDPTGPLATTARSGPGVGSTTVTATVEQLFVVSDSCGTAFTHAP